MGSAIAGPRPPTALRDAFIHRAAGLLTLIVVLWPAAITADDKAGSPTSSEPPPNKLTVGYYAFASGTNGIDINLRHTFPSTTAWIGAYGQSDRFDQLRAGYEYDYHRGGLLIQPSIQAASHGFVGGTLYSEVGRTWVVIGGLGRTNLRPYWNLGFDLNDFIQFGAAYHDRAANTMSLYAIRDNRLGTHQTNTHGFVRHHIGEWRLTVDLVREDGLADDGGFVKAWAISAEADRRRWFVRLAEDPRVNYTPDRQWRIVSGTRF